MGYEEAEGGQREQGERGKGRREERGEGRGGGPEGGGGTFSSSPEGERGQGDALQPLTFISSP